MLEQPCTQQFPFVSTRIRLVDPSSIAPFRSLSQATVSGLQFLPSSKRWSFPNPSVLHSICFVLLLEQPLTQLDAESLHPFQMFSWQATALTQLYAYRHGFEHRPQQLEFLNAHSILALTQCSQIVAIFSAMIAYLLLVVLFQQTLPLSC